MIETDRYVRCNSDVPSVINFPAHTGFEKHDIRDGEENLVDDFCFELHN